MVSSKSTSSSVCESTSSGRLFVRMRSLPVFFFLAMIASSFWRSWSTSLSGDNALALGR